MKNKKNQLVIIILNLNGKQFIKNCLISIKKNTVFNNYKIIVVDNGSNDGSQEMIKSEFKYVDLIENEVNRGFSGGNNDAIKYATKKHEPDYFYLLNNDTLVKKGWLQEAVKVIIKNKHVGIVGSKQLTFNNEQTTSAGWIKMFGVKYYYGDKDMEVGWVSGAGFLVKKEVFEKIGLLDEIYNPGYYEETDLEKRAISSGFKIMHSTKSIFMHKGGVTSRNIIKNFPSLFYRNRFIYFYRHYGFIYFLPRILLDIYRQFKKEKIKGVTNLLSYYRNGYSMNKI